MTITNYDQSSSGVNIELNCFYDLTLAEHDFDNSFNVLQYADRRKTAILVWSALGNVNVSDFDPADVENYDLTETDSKTLFKAYFDQVGGDVKDILSDLDGLYDIVPMSQCETETMANAIREFINDDNEFIEFITDHASPTYEVIESRGYSQGDVATVYIPRNVIDSYYENMSWIEDHNLFETRSLIDHISGLIDNIIWNAPVYANLTVDGKEYQLEEYLSDQYEWDRDDVLESEKLHKSLGDKVKIVMEFLHENLPVDLGHR